ncbi:G protein pathway suppressor 1 [Coprinopsis cinerea okayama7|uniref:G protein pathway suppressor 1 n=1 Tax=Coprinopsis cinerea (strain Okayama-7 / 130 / ATCC MYA-4618 / FGSC 9003) TaxID=240176 RepID=A8P155_COPC7|nr:G protein pathway suppressor 1 [Coprinopsis cinerea okayama7\|eukprot:XP_001838028.2 G protein pathway suppressor 1 [Coprinopsis cinerea okayama7\
MDIDTVEEQPFNLPSLPSSRRPIIAPVDDAHPFDLEGYIANYTGRTAIERLIHIVVTCPSIAPEAYQLAVQHIHQSRDPSLYQSLLSAYEQAGANAGVQLPSPYDLAQLDTKWMDETIAKNAADKSKLEVELKTYTNNMIKESIRMAQRDLGDFYRETGDYAASLRHYTKSREFCTTSQHVLDMCLSILELLIEQRNYSHLTTYVFKADAALDAAKAAANANNTSATAPVQSRKKTSSDREDVQSKLDFATALSHLGQGNYEKAAHHLLKVGSHKNLGDWVGKLVAPGDITIYTTLCALATFPRGSIKTKLLENSDFSLYIEQEPYIRDLIQAYLNSNFRTVLELLSRYSTRHYVDIHLAPHVHDLTNLIRNWAVVLYFQPFATIRLDRMSAAFGWSVEEVEQQVVQLIQSGHIQGRVDSQNKILQAKKTDPRAELFARATKAGNDIQAANRKLLLRMRL